MTTKEELLNSCEQIETLEFFIIQHIILNGNTRDYSNKYENDIGLLLIPTHSEGRRKGKKKHTSKKRGYYLLHGPNTHNTNACNILGTQADRKKQTYIDQENSGSTEEMCQVWSLTRPDHLQPWWSEGRNECHGLAVNQRRHFLVHHEG